MFERFSSVSHESDLFRGAVAGLVGGLVASWVMSRFQYAVPADTFAELLGEGSGGDEGSEDEGADQDEEQEPATVEAAEAVSKGLLGHELNDEEKAWAGPAVHYTHGSTVAALYGALAEAEPRVTMGGGLPFGVAVWLAADEAAVPALGLSDAPWKHPPSVHLYSLASHLVYGLTTEVVRRLVRRAL